MKLLTRLEKRVDVWALLAISFVFFLLRLPSLFEPYWYGDEGIYQAIGDGLRSGRLLYTEIWDNKPPLLYVVYALFKSDQFAVRLFSLITGLCSVFIFYFLAKHLFSKEKIILSLTALFAFLFGIPFLEGNIANAENFMLPFLMTGGLIIYALANVHSNASSAKQIKFLNVVRERQSLALYLTGFLVGIAFLFKIVALFDFAAFFFFLFVIHTYDKKQFLLPVSFLTQAPYIIGGFLSPFVISVFYFLLHGNLGDYIQGIFFSNVDYVNVGNEFFIPQGYLIAKTLLLVITLFFVYSHRSRFTVSELFIMIWFLFSLFNAFFSQRPYTHYLLFLLPSYVLLVGSIVNNARYKKFYAGSVIIVTVLVLSYFNFFPAKKSVLYYKNFYEFITGRKDVPSYQAFFDRNTPLVYDVAMYLKTHVTRGNQVFIWGDAAQIYTLSESLPTGRYTVAYHIAGRELALEETNKAIELGKPQFIVVFPNYSPGQINLTGYAYKITMDEVNIYERIN